MPVAVRNAAAEFLETSYVSSNIKPGIFKFSPLFVDFVVLAFAVIRPE